MYAMFDTVDDDSEDTSLLLGQYYPNNTLMYSSLTLDIVATIFLVVGNFRSTNQNINYRFVDPCQYTQLDV